MKISDRKKWNNILIFICCAFIITFGFLNFKKKENNINEIHSPQSVTKITFKNADFDYTLQHKKSNWQLQRPFRHPVFADRLDKIIAIQNAEIFKHASNKKLDEFGFNENTYLELNQLKIFFGDQAIDTSHRYTMIRDRVFLIDNAYYQILAAGPAYWLKTDVLPEDGDLLVSISINDNLYKEADLINLADAWYEAKSKQVIYPADQIITPSAEDTSVTVTYANKDTLQFVVHKNSFLMNTTHNMAYELDADTISKLLSP